MIKRIPITACLILLPITVLGDDVDSGKGVEAFFTRYCTRCHDAKKHEGEFQLDTLSRDLTDMLVAHVGARCCFVSTPAKCRLRTSRNRRLLNWAKLPSGFPRRSTKAARRMAQRGPVSHYGQPG